MELAVRVSAEGVGDVERDLGRVESAGSRAEKSLGGSLKSIGGGLQSAGKQMTTFVSLPLAGVGIGIAKLAGDSQAATVRMQNNFGEQFGKMTGFLKEFQKEAPASMTELKTAAAGTQGALTTLGVKTGTANKMTKEALDVANNLAVTMNIPLKDAIAAVQAGYAGNTDSLRNMNYNMNQSMIDSEALKLGLIKEGESADGAARAQAVHSLVLKQSSGIMNAAEKQSGTFNFQMRRLWASVQDAGVALGKNLLPILTPVANMMGNLAQRVGRLSPAMSVAILAVGGFVAAIGPLLLIVGTVVSALGSLMLATGAAGVGAALGIAAASVGTFIVAALPFVAVALGIAAAGIAIYKNWDKISPLFNRVKDAIGKGIGIVKNLALVVGGILTGKMDAANKAFKALPASIRPFALSIANLALRVKDFVQNSIERLQNRLTQLRSFWVRLWPILKAAVLPVIQAIGRAIKTVLVAGFKFAVQQGRVVVNWFKQNWPLIKRTAEVVGRALVRAVQGSFGRLKAIIWPIVKLIVAFWKANWNTIKAILQSVWRIIESVVKTAIRNVLNIIKLAMQLITGDWRGAWNTIKNILRDNWENIKTIVREALKILGNVIKTAWNNVKSLTKAAWTAVKNFIDERISAARTRVKTVVDQLKSLLKEAWDNIKSATKAAWNATRDFIDERISSARTRVKTVVGQLARLLSKAWDGIKSATKTAWEGIRKVMEDPMRAAHQTIADIWNALLDGIQGVLEKLGMDKAAKDVGGAFLSGPKQKATPQVSQGGRGPNQAFARGGINRPGGMADSNTVLYGEAGPEAYVRLDKKTPQSQAAARAVMRSPNAPEVARTHRRAARGNRQEGFGPATYTLVKPLKEIAEKIAAKFGTPWNSYENHPPNQPMSNQPYWRERSVDWWGGGGRGDPIGSVWTGVASEAKKLLGGNLEYMLDPNNDPAGHWDHVHVSAFIGQDGLGTAKGSGSGGGGGVSKWISSGAEKAFDALMKNIIDPAAAKMGTGNTLLGSMAANLLKTQLGEAMGDYLSQKFAGGSGGAAGSNAGSVKDMIKRGLEQSGAFPATSANIDTMYGRAMQESGGDVNAVNNWDSNAARGTPSKGLFQVIEPTWECVPLRTKVLTKRGWLTHEGVRPGDYTIGYNAETERNEWTVITDVIHYEEADLVRIGNSLWNAEATANHKWVTRGLTGKISMKQTDDISKCRQVILAAESDTGDGIDITPNEAAIIGWIMGDGGLEYSDKRRNHPTARIYQAKPRMVHNIRDLLSLSGVPYREYVREAQAGWLPRYTFRLGHEYFEDLALRSKAFEIDPTDFILSLNEKQRDAWLQAIVDAEGHSRKHQTTIYQNVGPLQEAIMLAGYLSGHRVSDHRLTGKEQWSECSGMSLCKPHVTGHRLQIQKTESAPVWCVTTGLGSWSAIQDGQIFLTGNSNREGEFGPFSSNWNKGDSSAGVAANYMKSQYGRIVGASGTGYTDGGMPTKPHKALVEPHDLFLPLDNQRVMQSARTALGTAELRNEMAGMRQDLKQLRVHIADFDAPATDKMLGSGENGTRRVMNSKEGATIVRNQNTKITKRTRISG